MPSLADVVGRLVAHPKPVLCLDTCDILEVVQCLDWEKANTPRNTNCVAAATRLLATLAADNDRLLLIITVLVAEEWSQNIVEIRKRADQFLSQIDEIVEHPYRAALSAETSLPALTRLSSSSLVDDLFGISQALVLIATQVDLDPNLVDLAVRRVIDKRRPSHDGQLKDSIHFEHYLELARRLRAKGFDEDFVFVSKNRKDFWDGSNPKIHRDLAPELDDPAVKIRFFGSLEAAMGDLRI